MLADAAALKDRFHREVANRFGLLPNFFRSAPAAPGLIEQLWAFAKSAYLDNPLPPLLKERLFVHLSRFCAVRYCIVRHAGFLMGEGRPSGDAEATPETLEQVLRLLRRPVPNSAELDREVQHLQSCGGPRGLPKPGTEEEAQLFNALTVMFILPAGSARARNAVRKVVGDRDFELLSAFLAFIRAAHYWTELHPEIEYEPDMVRRMDQHGELAALLLDVREASDTSPGAQLRKAWESSDRAQALREIDERQFFLLSLSDGLRALAAPADIAALASVRLGEHLRANRVFYGEIAAMQLRVAREYTDGVSSALGEHSLEPFGPDYLTRYRSGAIIQVSDVDTDPKLTDSARSGLRERQVAAFVDIVLFEEEQQVSILAVQSATPRTWSSEEMNLIRDVGERTRSAIERARAEAALRKSEQRLQRVLETDAVAVLFFNSTGVLIDANDVFLRMTGYTRDDLEAAHLTWQQMTPPEWQEISQIQMERLSISGRIGPYEKEYTRKDGSRAWMLFAGRDLGDGTIVEYGVDIDARKRAEAALRESEERLRQFGEASQDVLWMRDAQTFQWEYLTPAFETIYGLEREAALRGDNMVRWLDLVVPEDRKLAAASLARVRDGERVTFEYRIRRPLDGGIRWLRDTDFPITDTTGQVAHIGGIAHDITALKEADDRVRGSEERLRLALQAARMGTWDWDIAANRVAWSDEHFRLEGYEIGEVEPSYAAWAARIHPDDRVAAEQSLVKSRDEHVPYVSEFRSLHPDGTVLWVSAAGKFFYNADGVAVRMIGMMHDVTQRREWQEQQHVLVVELQHRTRNLMGVIRSMAEKTGRRSANFQEFREHFRDRLDALARVQGLLSRLNEHDRVTFDQLIETELEAMDGMAERVNLHGPKGVRLRSSMVQTLAMALHELATNALKYGALAQSEGRLCVSWVLEPGGPGNRPWLHIDWRETGVSMPPAGSAPSGGQGRELIERALPYQLSAKTTYDLGSDGVHCTISIPVSASNVSGS